MSTVKNEGRGGRLGRRTTRRLISGGASLAVITLGAVGVVRFLYADVLWGPELVVTPADISLKGEFPPPDGWTEGSVAAVLAFANELPASSVVVLYDGGVVGEWGETDRRISAHSVRKSLVSALYGIAVDRGLVDIHATLGELGVEEVGRPLTDVEKSAQIRDLLTARSGIYHPSIKDDNGPYPEPGTHRPDEAFVYNNWSFNTVGGIFEQLAGLSLGVAFKEWIADPIGMQDFRVEDVVYFEGPESVFPAYRFWMSGRDLARFGLLYLNDGRWGDREVIPASWIAESLERHSEVGRDEGYGYMWRIMPDDSYVASGTGGQKIRVYPEKKLVIVTRVETGSGFRRQLWWRFGRSLSNGDVNGIRRRLERAIPDILGIETDG